MKVLIKYFAKGEFGEQIFSTPTFHTTGEQELYDLIKKAVSKRIDATCFIYLQNNEQKKVYFKAWRDDGKFTVQYRQKVAGKAEQESIKVFMGKAVQKSIKEFVGEAYALYLLISEDKRGEE